MTVKNLVIILGCLLIAAIFGLCVLVFSVSQTQLSKVENEIAVEGAKAFMQLIVVVLIGGAVTALFQAIQDRRKKILDAEQRLIEDNKLRSEIRVDYLARVGAAYRNAKGTRRALRAGGLTTRFDKAPKILSEEQLKIYEQQMSILNTSQLELEALKIEAGSLPALLGLDQLPDLLSSMEKYLRKVVKEYEQASASLQTGNESVNFQLLEKLMQFSGEASSGGLEGFEARVATPHDQVIKLITKHTTEANRA